MNEFRRRVVLTICLLGCVVCMFFGIRQIVNDQKNDNNGFAPVSWDVPKIPYYRGGSAYRAPSSQGSTVTMPSVSSSSQRLFHHSAVGTSAGQGAGTYRSGYAQAGYGSSYAYANGRPVHTFSNGAIHSYGGGGGSGGATGVSANRKASSSGGSAGYSMPSISISMPRARSYAYNNVQESSETTPARMAIQGRRNAHPVEDGDKYGDEGEDTEVEGLWWLWDGEEWILPIGSTKVDNGKIYRWDGTGWIFVQDQSGPDTPVGDMPWMLLLLMAGGYVVVKSVRRNSTSLS